MKVLLHLILFIMANLLDSDIYQQNEIRNALKNRKSMLDKYAKMLSTQQE